MLQEEILAFYCTFISLGGTYLPVLKSLVYTYEKWQMNRLWLTLIYLYRWYIPDLIRLKSDIATNPGPAVVDNIDSSKTICTPYSSSNILSSLGNRQFFRKLSDSVTAKENRVA